MLSRQDIEDLKESYLQKRDRLIANVNVMQGAVDGLASLLDVWDRKEFASKVKEEGFEGKKLEGDA